MTELRTLFFFAFFLIGLVPLRAQVPGDSLRRRYDRETIFLYNSRVYFKNYRTYPIGLGGVRMRREFEQSPQGLTEYEKARKNRNRGQLLSLLGGVAVVVAPQLIIRGPKSANTSLYLLFGGLAVTAGGSFLNQKAYNQLQYAVWLRNRDILLYGGPPPVR